MRLGSFWKSHYGGFFVSLLGFLAAGFLSLFPLRIQSSTRHFVQNIAALSMAPVDWGVVIFHLLWFAFALSLLLRLRAEKRSSDEDLDKTLAAIHRSPNPYMYEEYPPIFSRAADYASDLTSSVVTAREERLEELATGIVDILRRVVELTYAFNGQKRSVIGSNIMLVVPPNNASENLFPTEIIERLIFFHPERQNLESLRAILYLSERLIASDFGGGKRVPSIALPVPNLDDTPPGYNLIIPGAPATLISGRLSVYTDTRELVRECCDFDRETQDEVKNYFSPEGAGSDIRSFASLRLGSETDPVGVLNIDSNEANLLGQSDLYYVTFHALLAPLARMLRGPVAEYAELSYQLGVKQ